MAKAKQQRKPGRAQIAAAAMELELPESIDLDEVIKFATSADNPTQALKDIEENPDDFVAMLERAAEADAAGTVAEEAKADEIVEEELERDPIAKLSVPIIALPLAAAGYGQSPDHLPRHVELQLEHRQKFALACVMRACREEGVTLKNGRKVERATDTVRYLLEQAFESMIEAGGFE